MLSGRLVAGADWVGLPPVCRTNLVIDGIESPASLKLSGAGAVCGR